MSSSPRILVVGDVMIDRYWFGEVTRISPEAPVPIVRVTRTEDRLGGAANVAHNAAALGASVTLLAAVGDDDDGDAMRSLCSGAGILPILHADKASSTIVKTRVIGHQQQMLRIDVEERPSLTTLKAKLADYEKHVEWADLVIMSDYHKGNLLHVSDMIRIAKECGKPVFVDPKGDDWVRYTGASLIKPNLAELRSVIGKWKDESELRTKAQYLRKDLKLKALLVTRGDAGMTLFTDYGVTHVESLAREVFDVSGAGDTVIATLAVSFVSGKSLAGAVRAANAAAGLVVGKLGTSVVTMEEMNAVPDL